jgi:hypothetical protein
MYFPPEQSCLETFFQNFSNLELLSVINDDSLELDEGKVLSKKDIGQF